MSALRDNPVYQELSARYSAAAIVVIGRYVLEHTYPGHGVVRDLTVCGSSWTDGDFLQVAERVATTGLLNVSRDIANTRCRAEPHSRITAADVRDDILRLACDLIGNNPLAKPFFDPPTPCPEIEPHPASGVSTSDDVVAATPSVNPSIAKSIYVDGAYLVIWQPTPQWDPRALDQRTFIPLTEARRIILVESTDSVALQHASGSVFTTIRIHDESNKCVDASEIGAHIRNLLFPRVHNSSQ